MDAASQPRGVTKNDVRRAIDQLLAAGRTPTNDAVLAITRGSKTTVNRLMREVMAERAQEAEAALVIPDAVKQEVGDFFQQLMKTIGKLIEDAVGQVKTDMQAKVDQAESERNDAEEEKLLADEQIEQLQAAHGQLQQSFNGLQVELTREKALREAAEQDRTRLQEEAAQMRKERDQAIARAETASEEGKRLTGQLVEAQAEGKRLSDELKRQQTAEQELRRDLADLGKRVEDRDKTIAGLNGEKERLASRAEADARTISELRQDLNRTHDELARAAEAKGKSDKQAEVLGPQVHDLKEMLAQTQKAQAGQQQTLERLHEENNRLHETIRQQQSAHAKEVDALQAQVEALKKKSARKASE